MEDADDRIVEDIKKLTQGFATGISDIAFNVIAGTVYVYRLWRAYGWIYAVAPYAYLFFGFRLVDKLTPVNWAKLMGGQQSAFAKYRQAHTRLQLNSEAVAALQGSAHEGAVIERAYQHVHEATLLLNRQQIWFGFFDQWISRFLATKFCLYFILLPGTFSPLHDEIDTIEKMGETRALIGAQWMMFFSSFGEPHGLLLTS